MHNKKLNIETFLLLLGELDREKWAATIEKNGCIHLRREGSETIFSPLTAVYFHLTGIEIHRGTFWVAELTDEYGFPWYEVLEASYAWMKCDVAGKKYSPTLRDQMVNILTRSMLFDTPKASS